MGHTVSPETRAKLSASNTGNRMSDDARAKMAAAKRGSVMSVTQRAKISATLAGKPKGQRRLPPPKTDETKLKLSLANRGKRPCEAAIVAVRAANTGRKLSSQHKAKISAGIGMAWEEGRKRVDPTRYYTTLAQALHAHLSGLGLALEPEVRFGRFTVDLYDREHHVAYEADGKYWHDLAESRRPGVGAARDAHLAQRFGLKVVHFTEKEIGALTGWPRKRKAA